jgi:hypothetical protein
MKIISKFKDYYDGVQSLGMDTQVIYFRAADTIDIPDPELFAAIFNKHLEYGGHLDMRSNACHRYGNVHIIKVLLGFCGILYECYTVIEFTDLDKLTQLHFHVKDDLLEYLHSKSSDFFLDDLRYYAPRAQRERKKIKWQDAIPELGLPDTKATCDNLFHALQQPIFLYPAYIYNAEFWKTSGWSRMIKKLQGKDLVINPRLHDLNFQKVKDAYQCYQELDMYLSGVLGKKENHIDTRTNIEKVRSHGFDEKYGFRKRKDT